VSSAAWGVALAMLVVRVFGVWWVVFGVWGLVFGIWCLVFGV